ncbi:MAG TPA: hypothetical protein VKM55_04310 [Candidatus Lokiarchaeia archaeon]|nr:hypothetical protein [Candidatus Lokiarchaeia archaeon]
MPSAARMGLKRYWKVTRCCTARFSMTVPVPYNKASAFFLYAHES